MSKLVQVINKMISNQDEIRDVTVNENSKELFFTYKRNTTWSIEKDENQEYSACIYPNTVLTTFQLARMDRYEIAAQVRFAYFSTKSKEFKYPEAYESFEELYQIVLEMVLGLDSIFDNILKD